MNRSLLVFAVLALGPATIAMANVEPVGATPATNSGDWVTTDDYPAAALRAGAQGMTGFQLAIDQQGIVTGCAIVQSSGSPDLDAATCALVTRRARFNPATDQDGRPTPGTYRSRVKWVIPKIDFPAPVAQTVVRRMIVEADGSPSHCETSDGNAPGGQFTTEPCPVASFIPYRTATGQPTRKRVTSTMTIAVENAPD